MVLLGCNSGNTLRVDVITDLEPVVEFDEAELRLGEENTILRAVSGLDWSEGARVATLEGLDSGSFDGRIVLSHEGREIVSRTVRVRIEADTVTTFYLLRSCAGVTCPGPSDRSNEIACLAGECVAPECSETDASDRCGEDQCSGPAECESPASCTVPRCSGGLCLFESSCPEGFRCDVDEDRCEPIEPSDAGVEDASVMDVGMMDVGTEDAMPDATEDTGPICLAPAILCGEECIDPENTLAHCGGCDQPCDIPNATSACSASMCTIESCTAGFSDCNGESGDGCETPTQCMGDQPCTTSCDSEGTQSCDSGCLAAACMPPAEICNGRDDDCDGQCDEGRPGNCRVAVHRGLGGRPGGHIYTQDLTLASTAPYSVEASNYFYTHREASEGLIALYRCRKADGKFFLTESATCEGMGSREETVGFVRATPGCDTVPLYRLFTTIFSNHFYTHSESERDAIVGDGSYTLERVAGHVWLAP